VKVAIDRGRCVASGQCAAAVADVFDQREDDGTGFVVDPEPPDDRAEDVGFAAAMCPGQAITVRD
jgi:ferredoxin